MSMHSEMGRTEWHGRLTDGETARSEQVSVYLTATGLEISGHEPGTRRLVPYNVLAVSSPITRSTRDVLLSFSDRPGATLFVSGPDFARALADQAHGLTSARQRWNTLKPILAVVAGIVAVIGALWALDVSPSKSVANLMPDSVRQRLGDSVVTSMVGKRRECKNPAGRAALDRLVSRLSAASASPREFNVRVVDWKLVNAFATPGERIIVTSEIIAKANGPDELAGVLAHEMGHGIELHPEAGLVRAIGLTAAAELFFGGGTLSNIGLALAQVQYTRAGEREADTHALRILKQAGISTTGLVDFFTRLAAREGKASKSTSASLFRTHPFSTERAKRAAAQSGYKTSPALDAADWNALRNICR